VGTGTIGERLLTVHTDRTVTITVSERGP